MKKFSIVIPVYNTKLQYLDECLYSVTHQDFGDYEVIVVDDGSGQEVSKLLDDYKSSKLKVYHINNSGTSCARNYGINASDAEYLIFVDSDDILSIDYLKQLNKVLTANKDVDLILSPITFERNLINKFTELCIFEESYDIILKYYLSFNNSKLKNKQFWLNRGAVGRCVRKEALKNCRFDDDIVYGEDQLWNTKVLKNVKKIYFINFPFYYYRKNIGSATMSYRKNFTKESIHVLSKIKEELSEISFNVNNEFSTCCFEYFLMYLKLYQFHPENDKSKAEKIRELKMFSKKLKSMSNYGNIIINELSLKQRIIFMCYKYNLFNFMYFLYRIKK